LLQVKERPAVVVEPAPESRRSVAGETVLLTRRKNLKVIYVSGYTPEAMLEYGVKSDDAVFLQKLFLLGDLATTLQEVLDSR